MASWRFWKRTKQLTQGQQIARAIRADAWKNIYSKLGKQGHDKRTGGTFEIEPVCSEEARTLWLGDSLARAVIESLPNDAMKPGYFVKTDKKKTTDALRNELDAIDFNRQFTKAKQYERAYGGAALFPFINDGQDIGTELDEGSITMPDHITLFEPRELQPVTMYQEITDKNYGKPETYRVIPIGTMQQGHDFQLIHASRLIIFPGIRVSERDQVYGADPGWGGNVLTRVNEKLRDLNMSWAAAAALIQDFAQAVIKIKGLGALMDANDDDAVIDRILQLDLSRSIIRAMVLDKDDDFHREQTPVTGLSDLLIQFMTWFAAACDMSVVKLFGISPAGMNATGESDITMGDDKAEVSQQEHLPQMKQMVRMMMLATDGPTNGKEPEEWSIEFKPMRTPSAKETAETRDIVATSDERYWKMGSVSSDEVAKSRWGGDTYSAEMMIDWNARKAQENAMPTAMNNPPKPGSSLPSDPNAEDPNPDDPAAPPVESKKNGAAKKNGEPKKSVPAP